jgi:uncharacterized protein YejL (UPF0352 family)
MIPFLENPDFAQRREDPNDLRFTEALRNQIEQQANLIGIISNRQAINEGRIASLEKTQAPQDIALAVANAKIDEVTKTNGTIVELLISLALMLVGKMAYDVISSSKVAEKAAKVATDLVASNSASAQKMDTIHSIAEHTQHLVNSEKTTRMQSELHYAKALMVALKLAASKKKPGVSEQKIIAQTANAIKEMEAELSDRT